MLAKWLMTMMIYDNRYDDIDSLTATMVIVVKMMLVVIADDGVKMLVAVMIAVIITVILTVRQ